MSDTKHIVCPSCNAINRIPVQKMTAKPSCGKCHKALFNQHPVTLSSGNFQKHINRNDTPVVVDFWAPWCGPCKMMAPILEELKKDYAGKFTVEFIDVWKNPKLGKGYDIKLIPTQIFFDASGKERWRHEGSLGKEAILAKWKELGYDFATPAGAQ